MPLGRDNLFFPFLVAPDGDQKKEPKAKEREKRDEGFDRERGFSRTKMRF